MKLRLQGHSLRLRLNQSEVARLAEAGRVEETIPFAAGQELIYSIESSAAREISASLDGNRIRVLVPATVANQWIGSDETGIEAATGTLNVLIEKDFQCLHRTSGEDADSFPNPLR